MIGGISDQHLDAIRAVLARHPRVQRAILFGSRAKGCFDAQSDIDMALVGIDNDMEAESVRSSLEELPLPQRFDVQGWECIQHRSLREHIKRVGRVLYER